MLVKLARSARKMAESFETLGMEIFIGRKIVTLCRVRRFFNMCQPYDISEVMLKPLELVISPA